MEDAATGDINGSVTLYRRWEYFGALSRYLILVDGERVGRLRVGKELTINLPAGEHSFQAKVTWTGSPTAIHTLAAGDHLRILISRAPLREDETMIEQSLTSEGSLQLTIESV